MHLHAWFYVWFKSKTLEIIIITMIFNPLLTVTLTWHLPNIQMQARQGSNGKWVIFMSISLPFLILILILIYCSNRAVWLVCCLKRKVYVIRRLFKEIIQQLLFFRFIQGFISGVVLVLCNCNLNLVFWISYFVNHRWWKIVGRCLCRTHILIWVPSCNTNGFRKDFCCRENNVCFLEFHCVWCLNPSMN